MHQVNTPGSGSDALRIFQGGGEMGARMRAFDWDQHPLGNPALWPESLKNNVRLLLNSSFPMFIWWSPDLYMFHNDAYLPALGNKHPEALGARARTVWAEIWENLGVVVDNILQGGNPFYAEALLLLLERKGFPEETYWTFSYSPAFHDNGEVYGIFCACTEVTNMVLSERRVKSLKDVSEVATRIQTIDQAGQLSCDTLVQNPADLPFCLIYQLNNTATTATRIGLAGDVDVALPQVIDLGAEQYPVLNQALHSRQAVLVDCAALSIRGSRETGSAPAVQQAAVIPFMRPGQDQVIGFFISGISPRLEYNADYSSFHSLLASQLATAITSVQAREELARQQEYMKEIFQQAPVGIAIARGPQHIIDLANPGVCEIWGRQPEDVLGRTVEEALPEVVDQGIIQLLDNVISTGEDFIANELPLDLERNGKLETVYLNFIYHPLRDPQGFITGIIAVAIDISEQVKYRRSVEALNEELLAINADLDNFVYSASHDLKSPILNIEGLMHALAEDLPPAALETGSIPRIFDLIHGSVSRFKQTVTDLSEVAKLQRQGGEDVHNVDLAAVVREVLLDFETQVAETDARIQTNLAPEAVFRFSAKNIRSIVYNLVSNALKYRAPDRPPHIQITAHATPEQVILAVQDNGLGIDKANERKIFSMFKRLHDHVEGSGVGLYIVKRILENAGGTIAVESTPGVGSTFRVTFRR